MSADLYLPRVHDFFERMDGARLVRYDVKRGLLLVYKGGHGIHAYDAWFREVAFWSVEYEGEHPNPPIERVAANMEERVDGEEVYA